MGALIIVVLLSFAVGAIVSVIEDRFSARDWREMIVSKNLMNSLQKQPVARLSSAAQKSREKIACVYCGMRSSRPMMKVCCKF